MADIIKYDYAMLEEMEKAFRTSAEQIGDMITEVNNIIGLLEGGALLGVAGDSFVEACSGPLMQSLTKLQDKMTELEGDIRQVITDTRDTTSGDVVPGFNN